MDDRADPTGQPDVLAAELAGPFQLPRPYRGYLASPALTLQKVREWITASWYLRKCTRVGRWTRMSGRAYVVNRGEMVLGNQVLIHSDFARTVLVASRGARLEIGDRTVINYGSDISATACVSIGSDCLIGTHVTILDSDYHDPADHSREPEGRPVTIEKGAWIGNRAVVLPGVTIGEGSTVGAGSVVMTNVPPRSLVMGNPARVIKNLSPERKDT